MNGLKVKMKGSRNLLLAGAVAAILSPVQVAMSAEADTSEWKCSKCPFQVGTDATVTVGAGSVSDATAKFGEYNDLDEDGGYAIASFDGRSRTETGWYLSYEGHKLGLDTRDAAVTVGKEGIFSARLSYDGIVRHQYGDEDTSTPFSVGADGQSLFLPSGWVRAGSTTGMTMLSASLTPIAIETERKAGGVDLKWRVAKSFDLFANFRSEDKQGTRIAGVGNFVNALQIPKPIDSTTESYEFGVQWNASMGFVRASYYVSKYDNEYNGLTWDNPYTAFNGMITGGTAVAPDNKLKQFLLNAGVHLAYDTSISFQAAMGKVEQDSPLMAFTTNTALSPGALPRDSLNGDLKVNHYGLNLSSRPFDKVYIRGSARYDQRKDETAAITFADGYVESDQFVTIGAYTPQRYDYLRRQGELEGEYALWENVRFFIGMRGEKLRRTNQDVDETTEGTGYSGVRLTPYAGVMLMLRIGETHKDAADARAPEAWENPSFWKYNLANRDRDFTDLKLNWAAFETVTVGLDAQVANDTYRLSPYGLKSGSDRRGAGNITWMPKEGLSFYVDGGYQQMKALQTNVNTSGEWSAEHEDTYKTYGLGAKLTDLGGKWDVTVDYSEAKSTGDITTTSATTSAFPSNNSKLQSGRVIVSYKFSEQLSLSVGARLERLKSSDWALQNLDYATVPTLLTMGQDPYNYDAKVYAFTVRYNFGPRRATAVVDK